MAHDVFISHSAKNKTIADAVCATLEAEGIRCWIAPRDVTAGMEWGECIIEAIEQARVLVLIFTADANASPQIRREVERAANRGVAILPLRVEDVAPGRALEYFIGNVHWLDALTPPLESHLKNLADTIKTLLSRMEPRDAATAGAATLAKSAAAGTVPAVKSIPAAASSAEGKKSAWMRVALGGAGVLIVALAVFFYFRSKGATKPPAAASAGGEILTSSDGEHWAASTTGTADVLEAIYGTSDGRKLWVVCKDGAILDSNDGKTWIARERHSEQSLFDFRHG